MLPTPSTSHVSYDRVYEPAEDSYLLLDTLSSASETAFLHKRFSHTHPPLVVEVGTGSGVVLAFVTAHAKTLLGRADVLTLGTDINSFACIATAKTVSVAVQDIAEHSGAQSATFSARHGSATFLGTLNADLTGPLRGGAVDVLIFNPPYVPTSELPDLSKHEIYNTQTFGIQSTTFEQDSHLLSLSYAGGADGMEVTDRLLERLPQILHPETGVAYVLLCAQNKPQEVKNRISSWGPDWATEMVGHSGKHGGWEKLQILRIWRKNSRGGEGR